MTESTFWSVIQPKIVPYGVVERVENPLMKGMADVNYCILETEGWVELKRADDWAPRSRVKLPHFTIDQLRWHENRQRAGGRAGIIAQIGRDYFALPPPILKLVFEGGYREEFLIWADVHGEGVFPTLKMVKWLIRDPRKPYKQGENRG